MAVTRGADGRATVYSSLVQDPAVTCVSTLASLVLLILVVRNDRKPEMGSRTRKQKPGQGAQG